MKTQEAIPNALAFVISSNHIDKFISEKSLVNKDAIAVLHMAKEAGAHAVFTGPMTDEDGGILGGCCPDDGSVMLVVRMILERLGQQISGGFSQWVILTDDAKTKKRVTKHIKKQQRYH